MTPLVLLILDGFGLSPQVNGNAIFNAQTPNFDQLLSYFPHASLGASGEEVGLAWGEMGNSEVGHLNLGTGHIVLQDLPRIDRSIQDGSFFRNIALIEAFNKAVKDKSAVHLIGLTSAGGVHSHINHLLALMEFAKKRGVTKLYIHAITDGRDTPQKVAMDDLKQIDEKCKSLKLGEIATIVGRYFAMDRDNRWDRTQKAYDALVDESDASQAENFTEALTAAYNKNQTDEFIEPIIIKNVPRIADNDAIIFFNFRPDRAKQLTQSINDSEFKGFKRSKVLKNIFFVSFTSYGFEPTPNFKIAFFASRVANQLAKVIAENNLTQLHIAETEKYPHVTYFFNGGQEDPFQGEARMLIPSPQVATYDLKPEMSANEVTQKFIEYFQAKKPVLSVINLANPDMVGHTGVFDKVVQAIQVVDSNLGKISNAVLSAGANLIVTADHGNAEQMINPTTGQVDKEHTANPVPLILALNEKRLNQPINVDLSYKVELAARTQIGVLADVTATCVDVLELKLPADMTGQSLKGAI